MSVCGEAFFKTFPVRMIHDAGFFFHIESVRKCEQMVALFSISIQAS